MTRVDIGECEIKLRNFYHIPDNETLYMKKIDIYQEGMKTIKVEYDVYAKLFGNNLIKLNLTVCGTRKICIYIPIVINENIDKYNSSSGYYNDICYTTTSEDGTDILLKDRQKEFIGKDRVICQEDCDFSEYDYDNLVAKCSCDAKDCAESYADMKINKNKLLENFKNIKNIEQELTSESFCTTDLDNGIDKIIEKEKLKITFTTTQNQRNNIYIIII